MGGTFLLIWRLRLKRKLFLLILLLAAMPIRFWAAVADSDFAVVPSTQRTRVQPTAGAPGHVLAT
jgi:hypothetical protein